MRSILVCEAGSEAHELERSDLRSRMSKGKNGRSSGFCLPRVLVDILSRGREWWVKRSLSMAMEGGKRGGESSENSRGD